MALSGATFRNYVILSLFMGCSVVGHAAFQKRFFYRTLVYLADSKLAVMAAANLALVSVVLVWKTVQKIFLGPLRFREVERLNTRARDAIIECCFATTIFREEVNLVFLALVTTLLMLKSLHWLAKDRMDFLEEQPLSPRSAHVRLVGLMGLLFLTDTFLVWECAKTTFRTRGGTMLVLFAFEFTVLTIELCSDFVRYVFHAIDLRMNGRWDAKALYSFYNELVTDLCQLTVYLAFFLYVQTFYTFPLHILREVYMTFTKFQRRCSDFIRYRRVVSTMNELFADATEEELAVGDRTCIICREEMLEAKKLACGHMFHARCLQSWLKRQLSCPTCRSSVDVNAPVRNASNPQGAPGAAANVEPGQAPVGGAVPPPPDDTDNGPGFWQNAGRLWRHIAYGEPRDGGPPPANPAVPQQQQQRRARGPARRLFPNIRFGIGVERHQVHPGQMGQMGPNQHMARGVPIGQRPPQQLAPHMMPHAAPRYAPRLTGAQIMRQLQNNMNNANNGNPNSGNVHANTSAPAIDQLIAVQENIAQVRRQIDLMRDQVQTLLQQATEQANAEQIARAMHELGMTVTPPTTTLPPSNATPPASASAPALSTPAPGSSSSANASGSTDTSRLVNGATEALIPDTTETSPASVVPAPDATSTEAVSSPMHAAGSSSAGASSSAAALPEDYLSRKVTEEKKAEEDGEKAALREKRLAFLNREQ